MTVYRLNKDLAREESAHGLLTLFHISKAFNKNKELTATDLIPLAATVESLIGSLQGLLFAEEKMYEDFLKHENRSSDLRHVRGERLLHSLAAQMRVYNLKREVRDKCAFCAFELSDLMASDESPPRSYSLLNCDEHLIHGNCLSSFIKDCAVFKQEEPEYIVPCPFPGCRKTQKIKLIF